MNPAISARGRELLAFSMDWMDARWSDKTGLLDQCPGTFNHVRGTVWYATGLLMRQISGDVARATRALTALLSYQWTDPAKANFGDWARHPVEYSSQPADPIEAKDFDPNWREFIAVTLILMLEEFSPLLTEELRNELRQAIHRAAEGSYRRQVWALYSNIALLSAFLMDWAGDADKVPEWRNRAGQLSLQIYTHFGECKAYPEFNSPTYYGVDLMALALWRRFAPSGDLRQRGADMEAALWRDIGRFYHAGMRNLCGPWSRSYGVDMGKYWALLGAWIALDEKAAPPLPIYNLQDVPIGHENDITMTPAIVLLGAEIPADVKPHLVAFAGERLVERVIQLDPHRIATAWLSEALMIGAEADGPEGAVYTDHRDPIVFHWLHGGKVGWGRVKTHMPAKASALRREAKAEFFPRTDRLEVNTIEIELSMEGLKPALLAGNTWELPGLSLAVTGNLGQPRFESTATGILVHYPDMARVGGEKPWIHLALADERSDNMTNEYRLQSKVKTARADKAREILARLLKERAGLTVVEASEQDASLVLDIQPGLGAEGYRIEDLPGGRIAITGDCERGLLYGIGKFLHTSQYTAFGFTPSTWRGASVPDTPVRAMYGAFNFNNWYVSCPREELGRYFEDLGLWGINTIFISLLNVDETDPAAFARRVSDNRHVLSLIKSVGLQAGVLLAPNQAGHAPSGDLLAADVPDATPARRGNAGLRICPSHPEGRQFLREINGRYLDGYEDIGIDFIATFPYDSGGCGCPACWPWGYRGFVTASRDVFELARERYPQIRRILCTWCFDVLEESDGEFDGLDNLLRQDRSWVDYIMADSHTDFPAWVLEHGSPGGLPLLNFPEISMWGRYPWGGTGANPLPRRCQRLWNQIKSFCQGGFPYSEGIFEDINKAIWARFYWDRDASAADTLREYIATEFSPEVVDLVAEAVELLEKNWLIESMTRQDAEKAWVLLQEAERRLPGRVRQAWRWRILYLRGLIDSENALLRPGQPHSDCCDEALEELTRIYHAENTGNPDAPRTRRRIEQNNREAEQKPPGAV